MSSTYLTLLMFAPLAAWGAWWTFWRWSGGKLTLLTVIAGIAFYFLSTYDIHANEDVWAAGLTKAETEKVLASDAENKAQLIKDIEDSSGRRVYSFTQVTLPIASAGWYAVAFVLGVCLQTIVAFIWSRFRSKKLQT
ncbi:hypothetical protein N9Y42_01965 [Mariniblastus sp.]|nr:hypothetical protein [Mariniblastus sp.]